MSVNIKLSDIETTYRMGKRKQDPTKHRDIIVKFVKKTTRDKFYDNRTLTITNDDPKLNIYVNDHLTQRRQHLLYVARKLYKAKKVQVAWSQAGNILIIWRGLARARRQIQWRQSSVPGIWNLSLSGLVWRI